MKKLTILVGNIGSGKSTKARELVKQGYRVVSRDAVRYMMGAGSYVFDTTLEPTIKRSIHALLEEFLKDDVDIVYDEVNVSKEMREPIIRLAKKYNYEITAIVIPSNDRELCINRRLNDPHGEFDRGDWEYVWETFNDMYERPTLDEGINIIK